MKLHTTVSLVALALIASPALADNPPTKQPGHWAQDYTHRAADPAVLFGTLPNGLRYAIQHNETPADGVAMRMRIGSGSLEERGEEQGLAHYLEHMSFRGSAHIADGEVVHMLERQGLRFGPDTNAYTMHEQTVYMFNFPKADASALDTGLTLFREIGERLNLAPAAIEAERGVVLSEERLRDVPPYRALKANIGNALAGTLAPKRWPIGTVETIKAASPERLRRFYQANYRPDNATLVIVGNIDPRKVEAEIKARFADWKAVTAATKPTLNPPAPERPATEYVAPGAQDALTLSWLRDIDLRAETEAVDREALAEQVALTLLNNRLADRAAKPGSPYVGAGAGSEGVLFGSAALTQIGLAAAPDKWREAMDAVIEEQRQLMAGGASADELKRAVTQVRTALQSADAAASTRKDADLADALVKAANEDALYTSPRQDLAFAEPVLAALTLTDVAAALNRLFAGKGPVLFRSAQTGAVGQDTLGTALAADYARPIAAKAAAAAIVWPYTDFGTPSAITARSEDREIGATMVSFANGTRLIVKPTSFEKDRIAVSASFGSGRSGVAPGDIHALWAAQFMSAGGTAKLSAGDIQRWAQSGGKVVGAKLGAGPGTFALFGTTRPQDFADELQLLTAMARDPGFRPELGEKLKAIGPMIAGQVEANAGAVFLRELQRLAGGGDGRYQDIPAAADIAATRPQDLIELLRTPLTGPADVVIVGDIKPDDAIRAVQATFGAGEPRKAGPISRPQVTMPRGRTEPFVVTHGGRPDQAFYGEFWPMPDHFADPKLSYTADIAAAILQTRLIDTVREKLGLTYSPMVQAVASQQITGQGYFGAALETPQANFATFHDLLAKQVAELASKPVSDDELQRARRPLIEARAKELETNAFWLAHLAMIQRDLRMKAPTLHSGDQLAAITPADVAALFRRYIAGTGAIKVVAKGK